MSGINALTVSVLQGRGKLLALLENHIIQGPYVCNF